MPGKRMPILVGITGFAQSGKSSCGEVFQDMDYTPRAFADPLRDMARDLNPWLNSNGTYNDFLTALGYEQAKETVPGFREFLKDLGTSARKRIGADVWVRACLDNAKPYSVITDVRFDNERDAVIEKAKEMGGQALMIRVTRPGVSAESSFEAGVPHIAVDYVVDNDGSLDDLHSKLYDLVGEWMVRGAKRNGEPMLSRTSRL